MRTGQDMLQKIHYYFFITPIPFDQVDQPHQACKRSAYSVRLHPCDFHQLLILKGKGLSLAFLFCNIHIETGEPDRLVFWVALDQYMGEEVFDISLPINYPELTGVGITM